MKADFSALIVSVVCYAHHNMDPSLLSKEHEQKAALPFLRGLVSTESVRYPIHLVECYSMSQTKKTIEHISSDNHLYGTIIFLTQKSIIIIMRTVLIEAIYWPFFTKT